MATLEEQLWSDAECYMCQGRAELLLVQRKRWWAEVSPASIKANPRYTIRRSRVLCRPCITGRIAGIRAILESGVRYKTCQDLECDRDVAGRGFCVNHRYMYMRLTGTKSRPIALPGDGTINAGGYKRISAPGHPNSDRHGRILEHRKVFSDLLGRPLRPEENVHHKNGDRTDNRIENLELWITAQPPGQRVGDLVAWAREIIERYGDEAERGFV